ncbi:uncharacterized protein PGTG_02929 [Puccinia graminis f. sp. tritici CRL 75-36-700-3]|uniref:ATP-dependent DNA helicase sgs1 n=1 Tax=Puccinia graminis f. sp. tritici (strain CRL 75-36-700-3 / race SCCL) TaxID=418459 RepID=E3JWR3_PUCGT|nr:uncharacterized protein PGTG_02929 [Puccinia graminis f. sp. tritici CRL 75-36-700-3]EFP76488.1 hypothetical protein PGTG_02929 [Puccinia graminis f. sp. tritici CRL 75-36-700-3]
MALGLGQNWKRVRMVAHMGRGDPAQIAQMIGRCGRDGRNGLGVLFMEKTRRTGKNSADQFTRGAVQTDEDRIDALAITPVCLRIAFALDNKLGYIPLWLDDPEYLKEQQREKDEGFHACRCSNCEPGASLTLINNLPLANRENFDDILLDRFTPISVPDITAKYPKKRIATRKRKFSPEETCALNVLKCELITAMHDMYDTVVAPGGTLVGADLFDNDEAEALAFNLDNIHTRDNVRAVIGGECFAGQLDALLRLILEFVLEDAVGHQPSAIKHSKKNGGTSGYQLRLNSQGPIQLIGQHDNDSGVISANQAGSHVVKLKSRKELQAEKREHKATERKISAEMKAQEELRKKLRKEQVARIMADAWANHQPDDGQANIDPGLADDGRANIDPGLADL